MNKTDLHINIDDVLKLVHYEVTEEVFQDLKDKMSEISYDSTSLNEIVEDVLKIWVSSYEDHFDERVREKVNQLINQAAGRK